MPRDPHPASTDLAYASVGELLDRLEEGSLTSAELVSTLLERTAALDAFDSPTALRSVAKLADDALTVAHERDRERAAGTVRGALHGIPVLVKDNVEVTGLPGAAGSTALVGRPATDAPIISLLREAGAIIMGSTNLSEWANLRSPHSTSGWSATGGLVGNPWALDRSAGGSSSGSGAAVAAGLAPLAIGTETDGSIICPSSLSGLVGLKPTVGVTSRERVVPLSASQDSPGPMGRTVHDVARMFAVLSAQPLRTLETAELRFGVATNWRTGHEATDRCFDELVQRLRASGVVVVDVEAAVPGEQEGADELTVLLCEMKDDLSGYLAGRAGEGVRSLADVIAFELEHAATELAHFGHEFFTQAVATEGRAGQDYRDARARNVAWAVETCLTPALQAVDVLLAPSYGPAWKSDLTLSGHQSAVASCATMPAAVAGWPIANVPMGLVDGLPVGLAILGRAHDEWKILSAARAVEAIVTATTPLGRPAFATPTRG